MGTHLFGSPCIFKFYDMYVTGKLKMLLLKAPGNGWSFRRKRLYHLLRHRANGYRPIVTAVRFPYLCLIDDVDKALCVELAAEQVADLVGGCSSLGMDEQIGWVRRNLENAIEDRQSSQFSGVRTFFLFLSQVNHLSLCGSDNFISFR